MAKNPTARELASAADRFRRLCVYYLEDPKGWADKVEPTLRHFLKLQPQRSLSSKLAVAAWQVLLYRDPSLVPKMLKGVEKIYAEHGATWVKDRRDAVRELQREVEAFGARRTTAGRNVDDYTIAARVLRVLEGRAQDARRGVRPEVRELLGDALGTAKVIVSRNM